MGVKVGFLYVLIHPSDQYLIKVGVTTRSPERRLKEHNSQFDTVAGKLVAETGREWVLKEFFPVEDIYYAESTFFHRPPLTEIPYVLSNELLNLDDKYLNWNWVKEGLEKAKSVGIRKDPSQPPIPKPIPKKGAEWVASQLKGSGLKPLKGYGNGITKVAFECLKGHVFRIGWRNLVRFPYCPVCEPERFDDYTFMGIEFPDRSRDAV